MDDLENRFTILNQCHYVVLDEADTMIKENHEETLNKILDCIPQTNLKSEDESLAELQEQECKQGDKLYRITMMFSATLTPQLEKLARKYLRCPSYISIGEPGKGKKDIEQNVELLSGSHKNERLRNLLNQFKGPILIFVNHKTTTESLCKSLEKQGYKVGTMHGGKSQTHREKALEFFKNGKYDILIGTNLVARGIDIEGITLVINFDAPTSIDDYNHRIGRTGRAGKKGISYTFLTNKDEDIFFDLKEYLEANGQSVPSELSQHPAAKIKRGGKEDNSVPRRKQVLYST